MHSLDQLGMALGLASLAGINLYLTVLLVGIVVRFDVMHLASQYESLAVLGHNWVLAVAGVLFLVEFFADKVPWVDSLWDSVHTGIRPIGGTILALQALGTMPPYLEVIAGLLAGTAALTTHSAKAGTRLLINHSPEPLSNVLMSSAEDVAVGGGVFLIFAHPYVALCVFGALMVILWLILPRIFRLIRASAWLIWNKLRMPGRTEAAGDPASLPRELNSDLLMLLALQADTAEHDVAWTARCVTGRAKGFKGVRSNLKGLLVARVGGSQVFLVVRKFFSQYLVAIPLSGTKVEAESRFLSENLTLTAATRCITLCFPRGQSPQVGAMCGWLRNVAGAGGLGTATTNTVIAAEEPDGVQEELAPLPAL